jgi:hypothetical protein
VSLFRQRMYHKKHHILFGLLVLLASPLHAAEPTSRVSADRNATELPSLAAIKECLKAADSVECLDNLFRTALKNHSTADALELIRRFEVEDPELRRDCHPVVHAIGRETFQLKGNVHDSFSACDQTCHSG